MTCGPCSVKLPLFFTNSRLTCLKMALLAEGWTLIYLLINDKNASLTGPQSNLKEALPLLNFSYPRYV